jgi:UDP-GlcNAc:undecaprenyl-phosphate/decaprenyl-phosphate GlcNAc-1-phosphate transferase
VAVISNNIVVGIVALVAFGFTFAGVPLAKRLALRYGITDKPGPGHPHKQVTAKLGGVAILAGFTISLVLFGSMPLWMGLCTSAMLAVGIADDIWVLTPRTKLVVQFLIAASFTITSRHIGYPFWLWFSAVIMGFWLVATTNAFNLIDGLDGLACGIGIIACSAVFASSILGGNRERAIQAAALGAALLSFLPYNWPPATIFMGDSGSLPIGFLLGVLAFQADATARNSSVLAAYVLPLFVMLVPLLDAGTVTIARISTGRAVSARGLDHLHHRLLSLGLSHRTAVVFCCAMALVSALYATTAGAMPRAYLILTVPMALLALAPFALFLIDLAFEINSPGATYGHVHGLARMILSFGYRLRLVEVLLDMCLAAASYFAAFLLWTNFRVSDEMLGPLLRGAPWILSASCLAFYFTHIYRRTWRYVGLTDVLQFGIASVGATLIAMVLAVLNLVPLWPASVIVFGVMLFDLLLATRVSFRVFHQALAALATAERRILIVGAHPGWTDIVRECSKRTGRRTKVVGFVDNDLFMRRMMIRGVRVLGSVDAVEKIYGSTPFDEIVIAGKQLDQEQLLLLRQFAYQHELQLCNYSAQLEELVVDRAVEVFGRAAVMRVGNRQIRS